MPENTPTKEEVIRSIQMPINHVTTNSFFKYKQATMILLPEIWQKLHKCCAYE